METTRTCKRCLVEKAFEGFDRQKGENRMHVCKECRKAKCNAYYYEHREEIRQKDREKKRLLREIRDANKPVITEKTCKRCKETKILAEFRKHRCTCRSCERILIKEYVNGPNSRFKILYRKNHAEYRRRAKKWADNNPQKMQGYGKKYRSKHRENIYAIQKRWRVRAGDKHRRVVNARKKIRLETDINFKLRCNLRCRIYGALKGFSKSAKTMTLLGCSIEQLKSHLQSQFQPGMTWDNHGVYHPDKKTWHLDHKLPCASFQLSDPEQQKICFNYKNLQPLWAIDNIKKHDKIIPEYAILPA